MIVFHRRRWLGCSLVAMAALVAGPRDLVAQEVMDAKAASYLRDRYLADMDTVHAKVVALANAFPADKYSWRPAQGVRSVSEVLMHVVSEWLYYGPMSVGGKAPADFGPPRETLAKLEKLGIVKKHGDHYFAVTLDKALEMLDYRWDNYFKYNNPEYEAPPRV